MPPLHALLCRIYNKTSTKPCHGLSKVGRDSSVSIATRYGLDGPGIESRLGRDFPHTSSPVLGPTQPLIQYVRGHFPRGKEAGAWR